MQIKARGLVGEKLTLFAHCESMRSGIQQTAQRFWMLSKSIKDTILLSKQSHPV